MTKKITTKQRNSLQWKEQIPVSDWAKEFYILEKESAVGGGKFNFEYAPHLALPLDILGDDSFIEYTFWFASQIGKTTVQMIYLNYFMDRIGGTAMFFLPNDNLVSFTAQNRILPAIKRTVNKESLLLAREEKGLKENTKNIAYLGGSIRILGANSATNRKSVSAKLIMLDEIAEFKHDQVVEISERGKTFEDFGLKIIKTSTSLNSDDAIVKSYRYSEVQMDYEVKCPDCGKTHIDDFIENIKYPTRDEVELSDDMEDDEREVQYRFIASRSAVYVCPHCKSEWDTEKKNIAVKIGGWKQLRGDYEQGKSIGLRASSLVSSFVSLEKLVSEFLKVEGDDKLEEKFYNGWLSKIFKRKERGTDKDEIKKLESQIEISIVPDETVAIFGHIDVQKDHYFYSVGAFTADMDLHIIDFGRLENEHDLETKIAQVYLDKDSNEHFVNMWGEDDGFDTSNVHSFIYLANLEFGLDYLVAARGSPRELSRMSNITSVEVDIKGTKYEDSVKRHTVNTRLFKDMAQAYIDRTLSEETKTKQLYLPKEFWLYDDLAEAYTSEYKKEFTNTKGTLKYEWIPKKSHPFNHYFDNLYNIIYLAEVNQIKYIKTQMRHDKREETQEKKKVIKRVDNWQDEF